MNRRENNRNESNVDTEKVESSIMNLENLSKKYENILIKYNQAQTDYNSYKESGDKKTNFKNIKGTAFWGSSGISEGTANNLDDCIAQCSANSKCQGATFNSDKKYCWLRSGNGQPIAALPTDYAIMPERYFLLSKMRKLNAELLSINKQLLRAISSSLPLYRDVNTNIDEHSKFLNENYDTLVGERTKIEKAMEEYKELVNTYESTSLNTTHHYYWYLLALVFVIISIFILVKVSASTAIQSTSQYGGGNMKNFFGGLLR